MATPEDFSGSGKLKNHGTQEKKNSVPNSAPEFYFTIQSKASSHAVAVSMASGRDGTPIIEWTSRKSDEQKWKLRPSGKKGWYFLEAKHSGNVMTAVGDEQKKVMQMANQESDNQLWRLKMDEDGFARLILRDGKGCLSTSATGGAHGEQLIVRKRADTDAQKWTLVVVEAE